MADIEVHLIGAGGRRHLLNPTADQLLVAFYQLKDLLAGRTVKLFGVTHPAKRGPKTKTNITDEVILYAIYELRKDNPFSKTGANEISALIEAQDYTVPAHSFSSFRQRISRLKKKYRLKK